MRYPTAQHGLGDEKVSFFLYCNLMYNTDVGAGIREEDRLNNPEDPIRVKLDLSNL